MSVASFAALRAKLSSPSQYQLWLKTASLAAGSHWNSEFTSTGDPAAGTAPGAAAICDRTTVGALGQLNKGGAEQRAWLRRFGNGAQASIFGYFALVDRLAHVGGLSGIVNTAQTVAFPALTRFTSGVGVFAAIEIYTAIGATGTTATISYTNTVPTAGQTSPAIVVGGAGFQNARIVLPFGYASGDLGVTAVASVTLAASTATAGNFGVTLYKMLGLWPYNMTLPFPHRGHPLDLPGPMPAIPDGACLQLLHFGTGTVATNQIAQVCFFED